MLEYQQQSYFILLMAVNVSLTLAVALAACVCCRKKLPKNELLGLEGMVKLKNPDEVIEVLAVGKSDSQIDLNVSTVSNGDSEKRASTAAHRSLPDIPIGENIGDTGSELYETVADKRLMNENCQDQNKSPTPSLKQQASVSQHSSISQADDVSSPYSRVKNSPHDYAKVRSAEHPYAQLNVAMGSSSSQMALNSDVAAAAAAATAAAAAAAAAVATHNSQMGSRDSSQTTNESQQHQVEIPAASAIAGIIAASHDLPYMTPPITNQHFSGDSQDSSKGYTSISVREPLANILAQQSVMKTPHHNRNAQISRDVNDSHYATVSDDSDETYAAIDDPNSRLAAAAAVDIYTSGSETYAQIQPMQQHNSIVVSVEINNSSAHLPTLSSSSSFASEQTASVSQSVLSVHCPIGNHKSIGAELAPIYDSLRAQIHSRQASSSSNNSSMGNLGSPKPEKRQANSPLPPTPGLNASHQQQQQQQQQLLLASSNSNLTSGRNSVISVIECGGSMAIESNGATTGPTLIAIKPVIASDDSPQRKAKSLSPSKDIEGMYAKVIKKNKFSRNASSSQNNSPVMARKCNENNDQSAIVGSGGAPLDITAAKLMEATYNVATVGATTSAHDKARLRSNSYSVKDHGYETIPADAVRMTVTMTGGIAENRKSDCYTNILQKERQLEGVLRK